MAVKPIKVLIVDDSQIARDLLSHIINSDPDLKVIGYAEDGINALQCIEKYTPDVVTMDIEMPRMDGFEAVRQIMQKQPVPIIIVSSHYHAGDAQKSFQAIEVGALEILEKPSGPRDPHFPEIAKHIIKTIKMVSNVKLVTRKSSVSYKKEEFLEETLIPSFVEQKVSWPGYAKAVGIGCSLGGPQALHKIFSQIPASFPIPIFVVQHITAGFTHDFAKWLSTVSFLKIRVAKHQELALPGYVYIAPDNIHMEIGRENVIHLVDAPPEEGLRPAAGRLFRSMARVYGPNCIGVILTGMGRDGVDDLLLMKQKGAMTIVQSSKDCLMFGMPKEAIAIGAATVVVHLEHVASMLQRSVFK